MERLDWEIVGDGQYEECIHIAWAKSGDSGEIPKLSDESHVPGWL